MTRMNRRLGLLALSGMCMATATPPALASQAFHFQKVALQGEAAPGTESGTVFGPLIDGYVTSLPDLDQTGAVSFVANLEGPSITSSNRTGIWWFSQATLSRIARAGESAPEAAPGVFASFPFDFALFSPTAGGVSTGFSATLTGAGIEPENNEAAWASTAGELHLLVREGAPAPELPAGVFLSSPLGLELDGAGRAFFKSSLIGSGVHADNDEAFWTDRDGSLSLVLREGDPAPGVDAGVTFGGAGQFIGTGYTFGEMDWSSNSRLALESSVTGPGVTTFNNEAVFAERNGALTMIAREGSHAPGMPGDRFGGNSVQADFSGIAFNALGQIAFTARVGAAATYLLYSDHAGALLPVARAGDPAPGTNRTFGFLTDAKLSDAGRIAFRAILSGSGQWPPLGLWWDQPGQAGQLMAVAVPGDPAPGRPGVTIANVLSTLAFNEAGQLVFAAELDDPVLGLRSALLFADASGLREVVATRDLFDVQGSTGLGTDVREISAVRFGDLNADGQMAIRLDFADGSFGIYRVSPAATTSADESASTGVQLSQNIPNPFGATTRLDFALPAAMHVRVTVFDAAGRIVRRLLDEARAAGPHSIAWDGIDDAGTVLRSGRYWMQLEAGGAKRSIGVVMLRP